VGELRDRPERLDLVAQPLSGLPSRSSPSAALRLRTRYVD
jgi:hypothetical protein